MLPVPLAYVLEGHDVQATLPTVAEKYPAMHGVEFVAPLPGTNEPAGASVHAELPGVAA